MGFIDDYLASRPDPDWPPPPEHGCRIMPTRACPEIYKDVCGDRPCARYESEDETPWLPELERYAARIRKIETSMQYGKRGKL